MAARKKAAVKAAKTGRQDNAMDGDLASPAHLNETPEDEALDGRVLIHVKKFHHHGKCGKLEVANVYRIPVEHYEQINRDFPGKLERVSEAKAESIIKSNMKRAEQRKKDRMAERDARAKEMKRIARRRETPEEVERYGDEIEDEPEE